MGELAAATPEKRRFPWGDDPPDERRANLDGRAGRTGGRGGAPRRRQRVRLQADDRQRLGMDREDFAPYPGFVADPYKEYSQPWFKTPHKVLRGGAGPPAAGCCATPSATSILPTAATCSRVSAPARVRGAIPIQLTSALTWTATATATWP